MNVGDGLCLSWLPSPSLLCATRCGFCLRLSSLPLSTQPESPLPAKRAALHLPVYFLVLRPNTATSCLEDKVSRSAFLQSKSSSFLTPKGPLSYFPFSLQASTVIPVLLHQEKRSSRNERPASSHPALHASQPHMPSFLVSSPRDPTGRLFTPDVLGPSRSLSPAYPSRFCVFYLSCLLGLLSALITLKDPAPKSTI